jgi:scyllo-inositol 2-dehydrogenase (NADP+)
MTSSAHLRVALAGYGLAGRVFHAPLVSTTDGMRLTLVLTSDPGRQAEVRADHPDAEVVATEAELWQRAEDIDLVVVATANQAHVPLALAAVAAGKPAVVDKPLAVTAADAARLVDAAAAAGVPLTVFQNRRWDSDQLTLRRLLADGPGGIGTVLRYESRFERWRPQPRGDSWRETRPAAEGGGLLLDLGSHLVDQALQLFGPATRVYAEIDARRGAADDDVFIALVHATGVRSHLWAGALAGAPGPRLRVLGSLGAYVVDGLDGQEDTLRADGMLTAGGHREPPAAFGRLCRGETSEVVRSEPGRWDLFYPAVLAALRGEAPLPVDPADAVAVLTVLEAARRSAADGRLVTL